MTKNQHTTSSSSNKDFVPMGKNSSQTTKTTKDNSSIGGAKYNMENDTNSRDESTKPDWRKEEEYANQAKDSSSSKDKSFDKNNDPSKSDKEEYYFNNLKNKNDHRK